MKAELGRAVQLGEAHASQLSRAAESDRQRQLESVRRENSELKWRMENDQLSIGSLESRIAGLERQLSRMQTENADLANRLTSAAESIKRSVTEHSRVVPAPVYSPPGGESGGDADLLRLQLQRLEVEVNQLRGGSLNSSGFASPAKRATQPTQPTPPQPPQVPPPLRLASGVARDAEHRAVLGAAEAALRRLEEPREVAPTDDAEWAAAAAVMAVRSGPVSAGGYVLEDRLPSNIGARALLLQKKGGGSAVAVTGAAPAVIEAQSRRPDEFLLLCSPRKADVPSSLTPPPPPPPLSSPSPPPPAPQRPHSSLQSSNPEDRLISERVRAFLARMPTLGGGAQRRRQRWLSDAEDNPATASATASQERENWEAHDATLASENDNNRNPFDDENEDEDEEGDEASDEFADGYRRPPVRGLLDRLRAQAAQRHRQELRRLDQGGGRQSAAPRASAPSEVAATSAAEGAAEAAASKSALEQVRLRYRESSAEALYGGDSVPPTKKPPAVGISAAERRPAASTAKAPGPVVPRLDLGFTNEQQQSDTLELTQSARRYADQLVAKYLSQTEAPIY